MSFSENYLRKFGRTLGRNDAQAMDHGYLKSPCTVNVHDYGVDPSDPARKRFRYELNGRRITSDSGGNSQRPTEMYKTVDELKRALPLIAQGRPDWCRVRWIDVDDGVNGEIIEFLIGTVQCAKQNTFNQIVDMRQSAMALLLDTAETTDANIINFLLISRCPGLAASSVDSFLSQSAEDGNYDGFLQSEQISFLLQISTDPQYAAGGAPGTLITFQEGLSGDDFGEVRQKLSQGSDFAARHGVAHLLLLLSRCTIESATDIEKFAEAALYELEERLMDRKELKNAHNYKIAKKLTAECELMHRILLPMVEAFAYMCDGKFPHEILGNNVIAWNNLRVQVRRLDQNIIEQKVMALSQVSAIEDVQREEDVERAARVERSSFIMGLVLAMFSPLSFISGMYGMNFIKPNGDPGLPELMWWPDDNGKGVSGYAYFWILCGCCIVTTLLLYILAGLIPNPIPEIIARCDQIRSLFARANKQEVVFPRKAKRRISVVHNVSQVREPEPDAGGGVAILNFAK